MNERQLSERLIRVAQYVPANVKVADIGSDHAYLPCFLCLRDNSITAIAGEVNEGPYQSAVNQVKRVGLTEQISVRKGNGLEVIEAGEVDVITIAGMGGGLITSILEEGKPKLSGVSKLILQPNVSADHIRRWLLSNEWLLVSEEILEEDEKIYEVLVAERGSDNSFYEEDRERKLLLGPFLMNNPNQSFRKKWLAEIRNWERIIKKLQEATPNEASLEKKKQLQIKIDMVEEVLLRG
ncbi:tRNA (adenine(22)-N(1))-methyltransferase [Bacillus solitudinis]|uniref:tRNA (adenine(22)-N(1))-methyltransferase n=1 Tax=Bacillus solitudinis TaxID=2014074 RepID=UPI000C23ED6C|nr:tRNA (adenine(22)-N(1))-methyltransferase TrmK [Bacillus solitudinis]